MIPLLIVARDSGACSNTTIAQLHEMGGTMSAHPTQSICGSKAQSDHATD